MFAWTRKAIRAAKAVNQHETIGRSPDGLVTVHLDKQGMVASARCEEGWTPNAAVEAINEAYYSRFRPLQNLGPMKPSTVADRATPYAMPRGPADMPGKITGRSQDGRCAVVMRGSQVFSVTVAAEGADGRALAEAINDAQGQWRAAAYYNPRDVLRPGSDWMEAHAKKDR